MIIIIKGEKYELFYFVIFIIFLGIIFIKFFLIVKKVVCGFS